MTAPSYTRFEMLPPPRWMFRVTVPFVAICVTVSDPVEPTQTDPFA